ncbi:hypothetical protein ACFL0D_06550 [Thermoproteota archaeon]
MIDLMRMGMEGVNVWVDEEIVGVEVKLGEYEKKKSEDLVNKYGLLTGDSKWDALKNTILELQNSQVNKVIVFT